MDDSRRSASHAISSDVEAFRIEERMKESIEKQLKNLVSNIIKFEGVPVTEAPFLIMSRFYYLFPGLDENSSKFQFAYNHLTRDLEENMNPYQNAGSDSEGVIEHIIANYRIDPLRLEKILLEIFPTVVFEDRQALQNTNVSNVETEKKPYKFNVFTNLDAVLEFLKRVEPRMFEGRFPLIDQNGKTTLNDAIAEAKEGRGTTVYGMGGENRFFVTNTGDFEVSSVHCYDDVIAAAKEMGINT